jgi:ABC-type antimicrobial peptide transport system permease subunit
MVAGLLIAVWTSRLYSSMLIGLSGTDPLTYGLTMTLMLGAAAVAGLLATGRLRRLQPMDALRVD